MDLKWYLLPIRYQRNICQMINRMQNGTTFTIGPFQVLNYETLKIVSGKWTRNLIKYQSPYFIYDFFFHFVLKL